jgi:hypothetical protein
MKNSSLLLRVAASLCMSVSFVSCVAPGSPRVSQARQEFKTRTTYLQGIGLGALGGAAIGGLTNGLKIGPGGIGFNAEDAKRGAAYGAAGGAVAGGLYAHHVVEQRRQYQQAEGALDQAIAQAKSTKNATSDFNQVLASELRTLKAGDARLQGTISDANAVLRSVNGEINSKRQLLAVARSQGVSRSEQDQLRTQIDGLEGERSQLQEYIDKLARKAASPVLTGR